MRILPRPLSDTQPASHAEAPSSSVHTGDDPVCSVELQCFEGPLDLLLHLVRRHELDILDIPISFVCEKYLEYLAFMRALDLEVAGDYLVMAATLAYLKSRELVPQQDAEDTEDSAASDLDGPDPRNELIARLLAYQTFKDAASRLDALPVTGRDVFERGGVLELPPLDPGLAPITLFRLAEAYQRVLERARIHKSHDVVMETVTVSQRMLQLVLALDAQDSFEFEALFLDRTWTSEQELRSMLVVTLMSVLEMTKLGIIRVHQPTDQQTIVIERAIAAEEAHALIADYGGDADSFGAPPPAEPVPETESEETDAPDPSENHA